MRICLSVLMLILCSAVVQAMDEAEILGAYRTQWGEREMRARSAEDRQALAEQLLTAAQGESDKPMAVYLCDRAYTIAARDRENYAVAARALDRMKRIDPTTRTAALEKLAYLYEQAYRRSPQQVVFGLGHADVLEELAEQRLEAIGLELDEGKLDPRAAHAQVGKAIADLANADRVLRKVVPTVEKYVELARTQAPQRLDDFRAMAERAERIQQRVRDRQAELRAEQQVWVKLTGLVMRFDRAPSAQLARSIALMLAADLDRPDAIPTHITDAMDEADRQMLGASFRSPQQLQASDLIAVGDWYERHAKQATTDAGRIVAMSRATFYFEHARRKGDEQATDRLAAAQQQLTDLAGQDGAAQALAVLDARLAYVAPAAPQPDTTAAVDPDTDLPPYDPDAPVATTDPPADEGGDDEPAASTNTGAASARPAAAVGGRPMVECSECGRRFFPGWGVTNVTKCPRCEAGHENIFDFGND